MFSRTWQRDPSDSPRRTSTRSTSWSRISTFMGSDIIRPWRASFGGNWPVVYLAWCVNCRMTNRRNKCLLAYTTVKTGGWRLPRSNGWSTFRITKSLPACTGFRTRTSGSSAVNNRKIMIRWEDQTKGPQPKFIRTPSGIAEQMLLGFQIGVRVNEFGDGDIFSQFVFIARNTSVKSGYKHTS